MSNQEATPSEYKVAAICEGNCGLYLHTSYVMETLKRSTQRDKMCHSLYNVWQWCQETWSPTQVAVLLQCYAMNVIGDSPGDVNSDTSCFELNVIGDSLWDVNSDTICCELNVIGDSPINGKRLESYETVETQIKKSFTRRMHGIAWVIISRFWHSCMKSMQWALWSMRIWLEVYQSILEDWRFVKQLKLREISLNWWEKCSGQHFQ